MTVQKVCRTARDEDEVREALSKVWEKPSKAMGVVASLEVGNLDLYELESSMEARENNA